MVRSSVIRSLCFLFIVVLASNICAEPIKYIIVFNDGTEGSYIILNNDAISKRIEIKSEANGIEFWMSIYRIRAIIEKESQIDVTNQFITERTYLQSEVQQEKDLQQKDDKKSGYKIALVIIGSAAVIGMIAAMQRNHHH